MIRCVDIYYGDSVWYIERVFDMSKIEKEIKNVRQFKKMNIVKVVVICEDKMITINDNIDERIGGLIH